MIHLLAAVVAAVFAAGPAIPRTPAAKATLAPPAALNIVHHRLKRDATASYQTLEASIVSAYDRAKVPLYWLTFQSAKDPRDVLYLNLFNSPDDMTRASATYQALAPAHPELARLSSRLASMLDVETSVLTTRRDEVAFSRTDVDFSTMRAVMIATFRVKAGHEGQFIDAVRKAGGSGVPWLVYESTADSSFALVWPLRSRGEGRGLTIPRPLRELRRAYKSTDAGLYTLSSAMSRTPVEFLAKSRSAAPKSKAH